MRRYCNVLFTIFREMQIKKNKITVELLTGFLKKIPATRVILNDEDHIRPSKRTQKQVIGQNNTEEF